MTASPDASSFGLTRSGAGSVGGPLLLALALAGSIPVFWFGLTSLVDAWSIPEYSHGPIIPLISLFLFLREMRRVPPIDETPSDRWPGFLVVIAGILIAMLGNVARIDNIVTYGFIVWLAGMILISFGLRRGALFWPAIVHLSFMLPLPQFVYWQVSTYLQTVSSEIGVMLVRLFDIPVFLDGNIIDLGVYKLQVAEACSGLRYLFPMLSFSFVFAVLYQGPRWHKVLILLSAAPITVVMNSFRIGMIGVLVNSYGIEQAEGFLHTFEGWIIFIACVIILFGLTMLLQRLTRDPRPLSETLDIEFEGLGRQIARLRDVAPSVPLGAATALTLAVGLAWGLAPDRAPAEVPRDPFVIFPQRFDSWNGQRSGLLDPGVERVLGADDYVAINYASPGADQPVDLFMAYYRDQMDGTGIHSPEVCIPSGGWEVSQWSQVQIPHPSGGVVEANRAVIQKGLTRQLVYFWFDLRGRRIAGDYQAKFVNLWDSLTERRSDGALVRLITPIGARESEAEADARLQGFMERALPVMARFIPE